MGAPPQVHGGRNFVIVAALAACALLLVVIRCRKGACNPFWYAVVLALSLQRACANMQKSFGLWCCASELLHSLPAGAGTRGAPRFTSLAARPQPLTDAEVYAALLAQLAPEPPADAAPPEQQNAFVVATASDEHYFEPLRNLVGSLRAFGAGPGRPPPQVLAYDLGLTPSQRWEAASWCAPCPRPRLHAGRQRSSFGDLRSYLEATNQLALGGASLGA